MSVLARCLIFVPLLLGLLGPSAVDAAGGDVEASALVASEITHDAARLTGTVAPADKDTKWWIAYATPTKSYAATTPATVKGDKRHRPVTVSAVLSGLDAGVTVRAQLVAYSGSNSDYGPIVTFKTAGQAAPGTPAPADPPAGDPGPADPTPGNPAPAPGTPGTPPAPPAPLPEPVQGKAVVAAAAEGTIRVRVPGGQGFVPLGAAATVPVGSVIDATAGTIALSTAVAGGHQQGEFWGARFKVTQSADGAGRAELKLKGGSFAGCRRGTRSVMAFAAANRKRKVRRLWGKDDGGRFRTHGRDSVATVRGTRWVTTDRCDGTVTKVLEGAVDVRNRHTGRVVRVAAGERYLAKHRR